MYQNIYFDWNSRVVHLWDDVEGYHQMDYKPFNYAYKPHNKGSYVGIDGQRLMKLSSFQRDEQGLYESDVPPETRILVDLYYETDDMPINHRTMVIDIETEITDDFPDPQKAENQVTAISYYCTDLKQYYSFILDPKEKTKTISKPNTVIFACKTEEELLMKFIDYYTQYAPTIITGWNIDVFDIPYLYHRMTKLFGKHVANKLSPIGIVRLQSIGKEQVSQRYIIAGVSVLDYLPIYKKYQKYTQAGEKSSYQLGVIGLEEVNIDKVDYDGSLQDLYESDIIKFVDYNLNDVYIVQKIEEKLEYINLTIAICHKGHVKLEDVHFPSRYLEGAMLTFAKRNNIIVSNKRYRSLDDVEEVEEELEGAFVKLPTPGRYKYLYDLDATSMYPSNMMSLNISPETKVGKVLTINNKAFSGKLLVVSNDDDQLVYVHYGTEIDTTVAEFREFIETENLALSANGILYRTDKKGLIPSILELWFDERTKFKNLMKTAGKAGNKVDYKFYDTRQQVMKILLNSCYGVLGSKTFRFYDIDNAMAVTSTGQQLIKHVIRCVNKFYNEELGTDKDYVIYSDTDSIYCSVEDLLKKRYPNLDYTDDALVAKYIQTITDEVQKYVNDGFDEYALVFHNINTHRFQVKQELVCKSGFWNGKKKRYAVKAISKEGVPCNDVIVKGLEVVRSDAPFAFRKFMKEMLDDILDFVPQSTIDSKIVQYKKNLRNLELEMISKPTSVNGINKYSVKVNGILTPVKGAPSHVKSAMNTNNFLHLKKLDKFTQPIRNSEKIRWIYLKPNKYGFDNIALRGYGADPTELVEFVQSHADYNAMFDAALKKKIQGFYDAMQWGTIPENYLASKLFVVE